MISSGKAIDDFARDELGRTRFAKHLATALVRYEYEDSLVVALYGKWGTGKSTLLNFTEKALLEFPESERPIVIRFNPWNYSNQAELVSQFFDRISIALERPDLAAKYERASTLLQTLSLRSKPLENVPHVGGLFKGLNLGASIFAKGLKKSAEDERDLSKIKDEISQVLRQNTRRIVIILDDIDRLSSVEIRQMFQLVKALADFSNVTYLLAFDRTVVVPALEKVQEGSGEAYLEKIVNVPIELPPITLSQIQRLLIDRINSFADRHQAYGWTEGNKHLVELVQKLYPSFSTIRALDRFANVLFFGEGLIEGEVDYADFIAVSALQAVNLEMYHFVRSNEFLFVDSPLRKLMAQKDDDAKDRATIDAALGKLCEPNAIQAIRELLTEMFPRLEQIYDRKSHGDNERTQWERARRICASAELFHTYFQLEVPAEGFSAKIMDRIIGDLSPDTFARAFAELVTENQALTFLDALKNYLDDPRVLEHVPDIVRVLFDQGDVFPDDLRQFPIKVDGPTLIMQIVYQATRRLNIEERRFECLREAILAARNSVFAPVQTVSVEDQSANRYNLGGRGDSASRLVSDEHLDELEHLCREHIETWAKDGRLASHPKLAFILYRWSNWDGGDRLRKFILDELAD